MTSESHPTYPRPSSWQRAWPYLLLVLVAFVGHGFLLLIDWTFWEGAFNYPIILSRNPAHMTPWLIQGIPIFIPYLLLLGSFSNVFFASHLIAFLSFTAIGLLTYQICQESSLTTPTESLWIALLTLLYPAFQMAVVNSVAAYVLGYALFLTGVLLALRSESSEGWRRAVRRGLSLLFLWAGLNFLQSLYVFYFGFLAFYLFVLLQRKGLSLTEGCKKLLLRRLDFLLLPFAAWGIRQVFYPSSGYNSFVLIPQLIWKWSISFFTLGFADILLTFLTRHWYVTVIVLVFFAVIFYDRKDGQRAVARWFGQYAAGQTGRSPHPNTGLWLGFSLMLFVLAFFPYVVVDKGLTHSIFDSIPFDPDTRNSLLLGLPAALFVVGVSGWLLRKQQPPLAAIGAMLLVMIALESGLAQIENYANWQVRAVKDRSFIAQLSQMEQARPYPVLWVTDEFPAGGIQFQEGQGFYAGEELQLIARFAWPDGTPRSLIDDNYRSYTEQDFADRNLRYLAPGAGLENCQAELILRRNPAAGTDLDVLAHYYYYKFFKGEEVLARYLTGEQRLTLVFFKPVEEQPVPGCP